MIENKENDTNSVPLQGLGVINLIAPRNYSELTEKQLRYIVALQMAGTPEDTIHTKCFIRFSDLKPLVRVGEVYHFAKPKFKGLISLKSEAVAYFSKKMKWITSSYVGINPVKIGRLQPCDKLLRDTTFIQYLDAENYYQAFLHTKKERYLDKLMSTLYPTGKKYDNNLTDKRAAYFARKASAADRIIVIMWMMGIKEHFSRQFSHLFVQQTDSGEISPKPIDMLKVINDQVRMLTDGDITKKEQVLNAQTWDALTELNEKCKQSATNQPIN